MALSHQVVCCLVVCMVFQLLILRVIVLQQQMMQQHENVKTMFYVFNQQMRKFIPHIRTLWKYD